MPAAQAPPRTAPTSTASTCTTRTTATAGPNAAYSVTATVNLGINQRTSGHGQALDVRARVREKLAGRDYNKVLRPKKKISPLAGGCAHLHYSATLCAMLYQDETLDVPTQLNRLLRDAMAPENLAQHFMGWCQFW